MLIEKPLLLSNLKDLFLSNHLKNQITNANWIVAASYILKNPQHTKTFQKKLFSLLYLEKNPQRTNFTSIHE